MTTKTASDSLSDEEEENSELITVESVENEEEIKKTKISLPVWLDRPYHVWRDKFQQDKCCPKKLVWRELCDDSLYVIWLNILLICVIILAGHLINIRFLNDSEKIPTFWDNCLFGITTISTIGYGNLVPDGDIAKYSTIIYCCFGIPLFFVTLAHNTVVFIDICNIIHISFQPKATPSSEMNWSTSSLILLIHCLLGSFMFSMWIDDLEFLDAFYFSFISIATIGYGDFSPSPETPLQYLAVYFYLCSGVSIVLLFFGELQRIILWIHYYGRGVSDSEELEFKIGGKMITVGELVTSIAEKMNTTPEKLHTVLHDLDQILEVACQEAEGVDVGKESIESPEDGRRRKMMKLQSCEGVEENQNQLTVHSFSGSNQRTIPKDTEEAIQALAAIQHHLRKPSVRAKPNSKHLAQKASPTDRTAQLKATFMSPNEEIRKEAIRRLEKSISVENSQQINNL